MDSYKDESATNTSASANADSVNSTDNSANASANEEASQAPVGFLERKDIKISFQRYAIDALSAMAQGLFASLLIGTIFNTIGNVTGLTAFNDIGAFATAVAGPAMAIAIGYALNSPPLVLY